MNPVSVEDDFLTDDAGSDGDENLSEHFQLSCLEEIKHFKARINPLVYFIQKAFLVD